MLDYWDVYVAAVVGGLFCVNPVRYRNLYTAMGAFILVAVATATGYLIVTRSSGDWIPGWLG